MKLQPHQLNLSKDLNFTGGNINLADGKINFGNGTEASPSISFTNDPTTGLFLSQPGEIAISAGASAFVYLKDDGTVEMTGTTGLAIQAGSTADRPSSPLDGIMRYNLDTDAHETYVDNEWTEFLLDNDLRFNEAEILEVRKEPGKRQYGSIADALAAITDATQENPYLIDVGPGRFDEPTLVVPRWVAIRGTPGVTAVYANAANQHLFNLDVNVNISDMIVRGVSGTNYAAFYCNSTNTTITNGCYLRNIKFGNNSTQVMVEQSTGTYATLYVEGGMIGAHGSFDQGFYAKGPGSARINVRSLTTNGTTAPGPTFLFKAEGTLSTVLSAGSLFRNAQTTGTGIHLKNGATGRFVGVSLLGFSKAIWIENDGAGSIFNGDGINLQQNTMDIVVDHPGATGHFLGCADRSKVTVDASAAMSIFYSDPANTGITSIGPIYLGPTHAKTTEMSGLFNQATTMGLLSGGEITIGAGTAEIDVSAGYGYAAISDPIPRSTRISWADSSLTVPSSASSYLYFTNTGILTANASMPDLASNILLGRVVTDGTNVVWIDEIPANASHASNHIESMLRTAFGSVYASGSTVTENATARQLDITAGEYYYGSIQFKPVGGTAISFSHAYHNSGAWNFTTTSTVPNDTYDNGTNLTNLTATYYAKHSLYVAGDGVNETYLLVHAQAEYASLVEVEAAALPLPPPSFNGSVTTLIASIVVRQGATNIVEIFDQRPVLGATSATLSATSDHGNLLGLSDDDHPQYFLTNASRPMGGTLDMASHPITNAGNINGVSITTHASRHLPNGADPLTTSSAVGLSLATTNSVGTANALARADHTHAITGVQAESAQLTSLAAINTTGHVVRTGTNTFATRAVTAVSGQTVVTNGDGVSGNPTVGLATTGIAAGTYAALTVDVYGRATSGTYGSTTFLAIDVVTPAANWPVTNAATIAADQTHLTLQVRQFDDSRSEGVGMTALVPSGASNLKISIIGRPRTAPSGTVAAVFKIYLKRYPMGSTPGAYSAAIGLNNISIASGVTAFSQTDTTLSLSTLGLTSGDMIQIELIRAGANASDTLVGDFNAAAFKLEWL